MKEQITVQYYVLPKVKKYLEKSSSNWNTTLNLIFVLFKMSVFKLEQLEPVQFFINDASTLLNKL